MAFAEKTEIAFEKSVGEIMAMLRNSGADQFGQFEQRDGFAIQFAKESRLIRFRVKFPTLDDMPTHTAQKHVIPDDQRRKKLEQGRRQRGRALMLVIKAKLESVESEVETFEEAFLANVVMADGSTLYDRVKEPIAIEYKSGVAAPLMLGGPE